MPDEKVASLPNHNQQNSPFGTLFSAHEFLVSFLTKDYRKKVQIYAH